MILQFIIKNKKEQLLPNTITKSEALNLITKNQGCFFTVEFFKTNNKLRIMNCQGIKGQIEKSGYLSVNEVSLLRKDPSNALKQINVDTLQKLKIAGNDYNIQ